MSATVSTVDLKSVVVVGLAIEVVCNLVMAALWRQGRRQYAGLGFWALNFAAQTTGLFMLSAQAKSISMQLSILPEVPDMVV